MTSGIGKKTNVSTDSAISLDHVTCSYAGSAAPALQGISLDVREGEFFSILGPSGSGKTTALRVMAGFERVGDGTVSLGGRVVSDPLIHVPPDRRNVGIVFQDYALFPHLTVRENITFGLRSLSRSQREETLKSLVRTAGLGELVNRYPHELSGGQQQRVAVVRALAPRPVAVLLDEPFSNLDRQLRDELRREVRTLITNMQSTAILVTHDREEALALADRVAVLAAGRVEQVDTPEQLFKQPLSALVAQMVGPCEFLPGRYKRGQVETAAGTFRCQWPGGKLTDGSRVQTLIRSYELAIERESSPEDLEPTASIIYMEFGGAVIDYDIRLPDDHVLRLRQSSDARFEPGDAVRLRIKPDRTVIVFPEPQVGNSPTVS